MKEGEGVFMTEQESDFYDLVHILSQMQKLLSEAGKILDEVAKKEPYRFEHDTTRHSGKNR